jgi:hypothetical protein
LSGSIGGSSVRCGGADSYHADNRVYDDDGCCADAGLVSIEASALIGSGTLPVSSTCKRICNKDWKYCVGAPVGVAAVQRLAPLIMSGSRDNVT